MTLVAEQFWLEVYQCGVAWGSVLQVTYLAWREVVAGGKAGAVLNG